MPGAIVGAVGFEGLKWLGALVVPQMVVSASQLYGTFGVLFAVFAWLLVFGRLVVYSSVVNWRGTIGTVPLRSDSTQLQPLVAPHDSHT